MDGCRFLCRFDNSKLETHEDGYLLGLMGASGDGSVHILIFNFGVCLFG